jgi:hypothetical protein
MSSQGQYLPKVHVRRFPPDNDQITDITIGRQRANGRHAGYFDSGYGSAADLRRPARRGRVARAHAAFKRHPGYSEHEFCTAVETAFMQWESLQNAGLLAPDMFAHSQTAAIISLPAPASAEVPRNP